MSHQVVPLLCRGDELTMLYCCHLGTDGEVIWVPHTVHMMNNLP
jgi:hypothetical protein